ncbi:MAG: hypothetical protein PHR28_09025, partial [candidate division Zixibacteria bacterium]|nr:hypothetical protein [candidate division Zixibacteria bacterium]
WQNMYHQSEDTFEDTARLIHDTCYCSFGGMHIPPDLVEKVTVVDSLIEEVRIAWHRDNLCRTACVAELARMLEAENKAEQWRIEKYDDDYDTRTP